MGNNWWMNIAQGGQSLTQRASAHVEHCGGKGLAQKVNISVFWEARNTPIKLYFVVKTCSLLKTGEKKNLTSYRVCNRFYCE